MKKRPVVFVFIFMSLFLFMAACGQEQATETGGVTNTPPTSTPPPATPPTPKAPEVVQEPVDLVFYYTSPADWTEESFMRVFGDAIHKKFPYITPKFRNNVKGASLEELIAAKEQVDVVFASTGLTSRLTVVDMQYDITPLMKEANYDESAIAPPVLEAGRIIAEGGLYGLPVYTVPATMYYNKEILDKFGLDFPRDGMTWDEVYQLSRNLHRKDGDVQYVGLRASLGHFLHLNQLSMNMVESATTRADFSGDRWREFFNNIVRFYHTPDGATPKADLNLNKQREAFFAQRTAGLWLALTNLHTSPELDNSFDWDVASFPTFAGTDVGPQPYPTYFYITVTSDHKKQAFDAVAYLTTKEFQLQRSQEGELLTILNDPEVRNAFGQGDSIYKGKNVQALMPRAYAAPANITRFDGTVRGELEKVIMSVIVGEMDINTGLRTAEEESNKKIEAALSQ